MRWHCRLSHVAAHTKMLTIYIDDLIERPVAEFHKMLSFIDGKFSREEMMLAIEKFKSQFEIDVGLSLLQSPITLLPEPLLAKATHALESELDKTSYLTKWPCPSFRDIDKSTKKATLVHRASMLSANCSDPFVTCSVRYDQNGG